MFVKSSGAAVLKFTRFEADMVLLIEVRIFAIKGNNHKSCKYLDFANTTSNGMGVFRANVHQTVTALCVQYTYYHKKQMN